MVRSSSLPFSSSHPGPQEGLGGKTAIQRQWIHTCTYVCVCIGLAKIFLWYLSKTYIFHFHQELYWILWSVFYSNTICYFPRNFMIPSSPNFLPLWTKNGCRCFLQSSRKLIFFPLWECCKDQNEWNTKLKCLMNTGNESELPNQTVTVFAWSLKKHAVLCSPDGRLCIFC